MKYTATIFGALLMSACSYLSIEPSQSEIETLVTESILTSKFLTVPDKLLNLKVPLKVTQVEKISCVEKDKKTFLCKILVGIEIENQSQDGIGALLALFTDGKYQTMQQLTFFRASTGWIILSD